MCLNGKMESTHGAVKSARTHSMEVAFPTCIFQDLPIAHHSFHPQSGDADRIKFRNGLSNENFDGSSNSDNFASFDERYCS